MRKLCEVIGALVLGGVAVYVGLHGYNFYSGCRAMAGALMGVQ